MRALRAGRSAGVCVVHHGYRHDERHGSVAEARALLSGLDARWHLAEDGRALTRQLTFKTFARAMFLNRLAEIAEREGHLPAFCLTRWNQVSPSLTTPAIGRSVAQRLRARRKAAGRHQTVV
jgi:pterin-4a-carbinolamine dehydratase